MEPFNGAATGSGGEIRDRLAGGKGSLPSGRYGSVYDRTILRLNAKTGPGKQEWSERRMALPNPNGHFDKSIQWCI